MTRHPDNAPYYINGIELPCLSQCRDLVVLITSELSPSLHITAIAHPRANNILRFLQRGRISVKDLALNTCRIAIA